MSLFEQASRAKLRYDTPKGDITVEDLWDLPLTHSRALNLDNIAQGLFVQLREEGIPSFVNPTKETAASTTQLKFDIVRHVIEVKKAEQDGAELARVNKEKKQQLLEILDRKRNASLEGKSEEELLAIINSL